MTQANAVQCSSSSFLGLSLSGKETTRFLDLSFFSYAQNVAEYAK